MSSPHEAVRDALTGPLGELDVDLEDVSVSKAGRRQVVRVVVDRDGGVDLDTVAAVSQRVSAILDEPANADLLPGPFVLEVTSPGVDRPLTEARHWRRARTRLVSVTLTDGSSLEGRVVEVPDEDHVALELAGGEERRLDLSEIAKALVQVEFSRKDDAAAPAADESADVGGTDAEQEEE